MGYCLIGRAQYYNQFCNEFIRVLDLIAVVGDLHDGPVRQLHAAATPLKHLTSKHGTYYVTGNKL